MSKSSQEKQIQCLSIQDHKHIIISRNPQQSVKNIGKHTYLFQGLGDFLIQDRTLKTMTKYTNSISYI